MNAMMQPIENDDSGERGVSFLTGLQAAYVKEFVKNGANGTAAATVAGYKDAKQASWYLQQQPHIRAAIRAEQERVIMSKGATKAVGFMVSALDDKLLSGAVRFQCAKWLAEAAGHGLAAHRAALGLPDSEKPISEMTLAELDAFITAGKAATAKLKSSIIEGQIGHDDTPDSQPTDAQDVDPTA